MQNSSFTLLPWILGFIFIGLIYLLSPILTPFLIAALLAYLTNPIVEKMTRWHLPRVLSVIIVFLILFGVLALTLLLLIPLIQKQILLLVEVLPKIMAWIQETLVPWIVTHTSVEQTINLETIKTTLANNWMKAGSMATWLLKQVLMSGVTVVGWILNIILVPVVTFYLLLDWKTILTNCRNLLPRHSEPTIVKLVKQCDEVLSAFFRGQLLVMLALAIIYSVGLMLVGLQIGLIVGILSGLLSIVPYLGFIIGIMAASIAAFVQFGTFTSILLVWLVYGIGMLLDGMLLTPYLVGDRIGLHPVAVIFAVLAGGALFGFFGVLLALPVAAVIMVWLRFLAQYYRGSRLYKV